MDADKPGGISEAWNATAFYLTRKDGREQKYTAGITSEHQL